jgi:molecular chaperone Hsp33
MRGVRAKTRHAMSPTEDTILRAITDDGAFRVITTRTTHMVRGAVAAQKAQGDVAQVLADLLTGAVLVRESMAPDLRVQLVLQAEARARLVADTHPDGMSRGLVQIAPDATRSPGELTLGDTSLLQVARTLHNGALQQGVVSIPDARGVSAALMRYMQLSEQVVSMIAVGCHVDDRGELVAGGYLVQVLPEIAEGPLMVMTERLKDFEDVVPLLARGTAEPQALMNELLYGMPYTIVGRGSVHFGCMCSHARLVASLASLPKADIESLISDGQMIDASCDYCGKKYQFAPEHLRGLLAES